MFLLLLLYMQVIRYGFFALKEAFGTPPYISTWLRYGTIYHLGKQAQ